VAALGRDSVITEIEAQCRLEDFRKFLFISAFPSKPTGGLPGDNLIFPEKRGNGSIYVEADFKETIDDIGKYVRLVRATNVLGIHYESSSKNSELIWRQISGRYGRVSGRATIYTLMNLKKAGINFHLRKATFV
jgi:hypothetical protein